MYALLEVRFIAKSVISLQSMLHILCALGGILTALALFTKPRKSVPCTLSVRRTGCRLEKDAFPVGSSTVKLQRDCSSTLSEICQVCSKMSTEAPPMVADIVLMRHAPIHACVTDQPRPPQHHRQCSARSHARQYAHVHGFRAYPAHCQNRQPARYSRSEEHTSELQSRGHLVCRLLLEKKKSKVDRHIALIHINRTYHLL